MEDKGKATARSLIVALEWGDLPLLLSELGKPGLGKEALDGQWRSQTPMFAAVEEGPEFVKALLDAGASASARDEQTGCGLVGRLALRVEEARAGKGGKLTEARGMATLEMLLSAGALENERLDDYGLCSLNWMARSGWIGGLEKLLAQGCPVDGIRTASGAVKATPLITACEQGQAEAAELLISAGADVDARDSFGMTPLMRAGWREEHALEASMRIARALLSAGANPYLVDLKGRDARWYSLNDAIGPVPGGGAVAALVESAILSGSAKAGAVAHRAKGV